MKDIETHIRVEGKPIQAIGHGDGYAALWNKAEARQVNRDLERLRFLESCGFAEEFEKELQTFEQRLSRKYNDQTSIDGIEPQDIVRGVL